MRTLLIAFVFGLAISIEISAQLVNNGATIIVEGAIMSVKTDLINTNGGTITNNGSLSIENLDNNSNASISGDGIYEASGNWTNTAIFNPGTSKVIFSGGVSSFIYSGGDPFFQMEINKTSGNDVTLQEDLSIQNNLSFVSDNNKINIGDLNLNIESLGNIIGFDANDYVVTGGTGKLIKNSLGISAFTYPVGFDNLTYNPIAATNTGTIDDIGVRVLPNVLNGGSTGLPIGEFVVDASWDIAEANPGGSDLNLTAQWSASDELPGFDRTNCEVLKFISPHWELDGGTFGLSSGSGPYTKTKSGISDPGTFTIGHEFLVVNIKLSVDALLEGPAQGTALMTDGLRTNGLIPFTEPYSGLGYVHVGPGGGETIDPDVLNISGNNAIVDWIIVELRSAADPTVVVATRAALLQADGDIVDRDGQSGLTFNGVQSGDYSVAVRHRNHLGAATLNPVALSRVISTVDFTSPATQTYGVYARKDNSGLMTLWAGDADGDKKVIYAGPGNDPSKIFLDVLLAPGNFSFDPNFLFQGYLNSDLNMDGMAVYAGPGNDVNTIFFSVLLHPGNVGFDSNFFLEEQIPE